MQQASRIEELTSRGPIPGAASRDVRRNRLFGLVTRKERWGLSWKGWFLVLVLLIGLAISLVWNIYPFLAVTQRLDTDVLVVEGWVPQYAIRAAITEFHSSHYQRLFTTGGPITGMGGYTNDYNTSASLAAGRLRAAGFSPELIQMVPSRISERDRTYSSAVALRDWFRDNHVSVHAINVVTEDVHARRSQLLFQEAFGSEVKVGIIAVPNPDYDSGQWWRYSEGVKEVVSEGVAYVYAKFFFWPSAAGETTRPPDHGTTGQ
jgi:uncharacterized SAM-binding protein YcdF (DUF218 family)